MQVATNSGTNLSHTAQGHYGIEVVQDGFVVDGAPKQLGLSTSLADLDGWSSRFPGLVRGVGPAAEAWGTSLVRLVRSDPEVLLVLSSTRLAPSHLSAQTAVAMVRSDSSVPPFNVSVVDTQTSDVAAALLMLVAGEGMRAGAPLPLIAQTLESLAGRLSFVWAAPSLRALSVSGHRAALAHLPTTAEGSEHKPLLGLVHGEIRVMGRITAKAEPFEELVQYAAKVAGRSSKLWIGVGHGGSPQNAIRLEEELRKRLPVEFVYRRVLAPSSYLFMGSGALAVAVAPMDSLPWPPAVPPDFSETRRPVRRARSLMPQ